jgi:hypothetical protein
MKKKGKKGGVLLVGGGAICMDKDGNTTDANMGGRCPDGYSIESTEDPDYAAYTSSGTYRPGINGRIVQGPSLEGQPLLLKGGRRAHRSRSKIRSRSIRKAMRGGKKSKKSKKRR